MSTEHKWLLYDGRAAGGRGVADAAVMSVCDSEAEARSEAAAHGSVSCYRYEVSSSGTLKNERWCWDSL